MFQSLAGGQSTYSSNDREFPPAGLKKGGQSIYSSNDREFPPVGLKKPSVAKPKGRHSLKPQAHGNCLQVSSNLRVTYLKMSIYNLRHAIQGLASAFWLAFCVWVWGSLLHSFKFLRIPWHHHMLHVLSRCWANESCRGWEVRGLCEVERTESTGSVS